MEKTDLDGIIIFLLFCFAFIFLVLDFIATYAVEVLGILYYSEILVPVLFWTFLFYFVVVLVILSTFVLYRIYLTIK